MISGKIYLSALFILVSLSLSSQALSSDKENDRFSLSLGVDYGNGDYGTGTTTDTVTTRVSIGWYPTDSIDMTLEIPYLYQSNSLTTPFGGGRFRTAGQQQGGGTSGLKRSGRSSFASTFDVNGSQSGIGDLLLKGGYIVLDETESVPQLRPEAYVKFPTADERDGLGTGEFDAGIGLTVNKWFGDWNGYLEGVYNFIGKSDDFDLNDYFSYEGGVGYQLTDRFVPAFAVKGATNPSSDSSPVFETRVKALYRITGRMTAEGYLGKGFTDGTADYTVGAEISYRF